MYINCTYLCVYKIAFLANLTKYKTKFSRKVWVIRLELI